MSSRLFLISCLAAIHGQQLHSVQLPAPNVTLLDYNAWWGPEQFPVEQDTSITPIRVKFGDEMIEDLQNRLRTRRPITPSYDGVWSDYGINSVMVEDWANYWEKKYLFKFREQVINQFPHYYTNIQGLDIHFIWVRPKVPANVEVVPILLLNGWPSSVIEFYDVIPRLVAYNRSRDFALEVIVPSLPGFTLSQGSSKPGLTTPDMGVIFRNLMLRLGFKKYYLQGGDFGSLVCSAIATLFPEEVLGFHANMIFLRSPQAFAPVLFESLFPNSNSIYSGNNTRGRTADDNIRQRAYSYHQATRPDTLGLGLNDSPVGLLGYLLEKFQYGSVLDRRENAWNRLEDRVSRDIILDNVMLYWITNSITTSMRIYKETFSRRELNMGIDEIPSPVPTWIIEAKYETSLYPIGFLKTKFPNIISYKTLEFGGHFLAFEYPEFFANNILKAITNFRNCNSMTGLKLD